MRIDALRRAALCAVLALAAPGPNPAGAAAPTPAAAVEAPAAQQTSPPAAAPGGQPERLLLPAVPIVAYSRETDFLFGVMMVRAHRWQDASAQTRPNTVAVSGFYSLENQWAVGVAPSVYLQGEEYLVKAQAYYHRTPARFWGIGSTAGEHGTREDFTASGLGLTLAATKQLFGPLRIGPGLWYGSADIPIHEAGGLLDRGAVNGAAGGTDVGVELQAEWDGRDNIYAPTTGTFLQFWAGLHRDWLGSDFDYEDYLLDVRRYFPVGAGSVLAVQARMRTMSGDPPFYRLPNIGGIGVMRGLYEGRFRDQAMAAVQAEYRFPIWKFLSGALFAGVGEVAPRLSDLSLDDLQVTGGFGVRIMLDPKERINLRLDLGFSAYGTAPILVITEAF